MSWGYGDVQLVRPSLPGVCDIPWGGGGDEYRRVGIASTRSEKLLGKQMTSS